MVGRSVLDVAPECIQDVVSMLTALGVQIKGTRHSDGFVSLLIEGETVPDAPKVSCQVMRVTGEKVTTLTLSFVVVQPHTEAPSDWYVKHKAAH